MSSIKQCNPVAVSFRWVLASAIIAAFLVATLADFASPEQAIAGPIPQERQRDPFCLIGTYAPTGNAHSLSVTDQNGIAVNISQTGRTSTEGSLIRGEVITSYRGSVASDVEYVTISHSVSGCRLKSEVFPPDSQPNVDGHHIPLQHGDNLISIVLLTFSYDDPDLRVFTHDILISRAGSPSGTTTPVVSVYGLQRGIAKEGHAMPFFLTRTGDTSASLSVSVNVSETDGDMVPQGSKGRKTVQFLAGDAFAKLSVPTIADEVWDEHSTITVAIVDGAGYDLGAGSSSASSLVTDNEVPPVKAAYSLDSSHPQEGDVVTVTVTVTTDGPKEPHNYVGNLRLIPRRGSGQPEDIDVPYSESNRHGYGDFPSDHRVTGASSHGLYYGAKGDDVIPGKAASFAAPVHVFKAMLTDGSITHYQYEFSVPILIVDDERAENEETFRIDLEWDSFQSKNPLTMDQGITSRTITVPAHDDTPATPDPVSYITVDVADSGDTGSTLAVSWHDTEEYLPCGAYLTWPTFALGGRSTPGTFQTDLGATAGSNTQLTASLDRFWWGGQHKALFRCNGTVGETYLPFSTENSVHRPVAGTYSTEPALTSLTVTPGTLSPSFVNHGFLYSVLDVPDGEDQITLRAAARDGYSISWFPYVDADAEADGHQVNLKEGYNSVLIWVDHDQGINGFLYEVIVKGSELPVSHSVNTQATGSPTIAGTASADQTLAASTHYISDADGLDNVSYTYRWTADDVGISGATGSTYTLADADQGKVIRVRVFFTDDKGNQETRTSEATELVNPPNRPASGSPTISGIAQVGQTLTVSISEFFSSVSDPDGVSRHRYSIQWLADDTEISGATDYFYTLVDTDADKAIKARVSFRDDRGNRESLTSAATTAVAATTPGAPSNLTASPNDTGKLDLSWDVPSSNGGAAITGYKVQWKEAANSWDTPADVSETTVSGTGHTVAGLTDGTEYTFQVLAVNSVGESLASTEASGTPRDTTAPTVSRAHITVVITDGDDTVSWSDTSDCSSDYNTYLVVPSGSAGGQPSRTHIGSVSSGSTEATQTISYSGFVSSIEVELYCGTYDESSSQNVLIASTGLSVADPTSCRARTHRRP